MSSCPRSPGTLPAPRYLIGVDGGGSGTRVRLQDADGRTLGTGAAGPSGLSLGVASAWQNIEQAVASAFHAAQLPRTVPSECAMGLGLAGAGRPVAREAFLRANPGYGWLVLESDACTMLWGAHGERPGIVVAAGTGSVAAARDPDGAIRVCGGWGFPLGDEGGGAWLGVQAIRHVQACLDGRDSAGPLALAVQAEAGSTTSALQAWCARADATAFARWAPLVFRGAEAGDPVAEGLLAWAAQELARLEHALQPAVGKLPVAVAGNIAARLWPRWPADLRSRCVPPLGDRVDGALTLLRRELAAATALGSAA
jgi:glucosamine kinase